MREEVCDRLEQIRLWLDPPGQTTRARAEISWWGGASNSAEVGRVLFVLLSLGSCVFGKAVEARGRTFGVPRWPLPLSSYVIFSHTYVISAHLFSHLHCCLRLRLHLGRIPLEEESLPLSRDALGSGSGTRLRDNCVRRCRVLARHNHNWHRD